MLKRRYADRSDWSRVKDREYTQSYINDELFKGYVTLLKVNEVTDPLEVSYGSYNTCIVDDGYIWLQQFPEGQYYTVTTMFNAKGEVVQWYIDLSLETGLENNIPYYDDLFLDIVVLPNGQVFLLDEEELQDAFAYGTIDESLYNLAGQEANRLLRMIELGQFKLFKYTEVHKEELLKKL
ncbi:putative RNA-binding protein associated with RNAse of E/G family [Alkalibacillus filiformis]|uniref:RNA-binding protein associated with RNAse of E/G family n=1 Tax=Alkalibacillus filiformis TaxID=200990 RepID=A0ABU0DTZ4_9BACI|nr:DUF402 domain-containing protein [Alkalibacillus filiformis]MDQ0351937.1 putative RNA-binding protein associated with RNAse of E/G family [Alkalibacillus filiformis]